MPFSSAQVAHSRKAFASCDPEGRGHADRRVIEQVIQGLRSVMSRSADEVIDFTSFMEIYAPAVAVPRRAGVPDGDSSWQEMDWLEPKQASELRSMLREFDPEDRHVLTRDAAIAIFRRVGGTPLPAGDAASVLARMDGAGTDEITFESFLREAERWFTGGPRQFHIGDGPRPPGGGQEKLDALREEVIFLKQKARELEHQNAEVLERCKTYEEQLHGRSDDAEETMRSLQSQLAIARGQLKKMKTVTKENEELNTKMREMELEAEAAAQRERRWKQERESSTQKQAALQNELVALEAANSELKASLEQKNEAVLENSKLKSAISKSSSTITAREAAVEEIAATNQRLTTQLTELRNQYQTLRLTAQQYQVKFQNAKAASDTLTTQVETLQAEATRSHDKEVVADKLMQEARKKADELAAQLTETQKETATLRAKLKSGRSSDEESGGETDDEDLLDGAGTDDEDMSDFGEFDLDEGGPPKTPPNKAGARPGTPMKAKEFSLPAAPKAPLPEAKEGCTSCVEFRKRLVVLEGAGRHSETAVLELAERKDFLEREVTRLQNALNIVKSGGPPPEGLVLPEGGGTLEEEREARKLAELRMAKLRKRCKILLEKQKRQSRLKINKIKDLAKDKLIKLKEALIASRTRNVELENLNVAHGGAASAAAPATPPTPRPPPAGSTTVTDTSDPAKADADGVTVTMDDVLMKHRAEKRKYQRALQTVNTQLKQRREEALASEEKALKVTENLNAAFREKEAALEASTKQQTASLTAQVEALRKELKAACDERDRMSDELLLSAGSTPVDDRVNAAMVEEAKAAVRSEMETHMAARESSLAAQLRVARDHLAAAEKRAEEAARKGGGEVTALQQQLERLKLAEDEARAEAADLQEQLRLEQEEHAATAASLQATQRSHAELEAQMRREVDALNARLAELKMSEAQQKRIVATLSKERENLSADLEKAESDIEAAAKARGQLSGSMSSELNQLRQQLRASEANWRKKMLAAKVQSDKDRATWQAETEESERARQSADAERTREIAALTSEVKVSKERNKDLRDKLKELRGMAKEKLGHLRAIQGKLLEEKAALEGEHEALKQRLDQVTRERDDGEAQLQTIAQKTKKVLVAYGQQVSDLQAKLSESERLRLAGGAAIGSAPAQSGSRTAGGATPRVGVSPKTSPLSSNSTTPRSENSAGARGVEY